VTAALALVGLAVFASRFVPGLDDLLPTPDGFLREQQRNLQLREGMAAVNRVSADKHELTAEVIAGRLGLVEAAQRFREIDAAAPTFNHEALVLTWPGRTDEERYCREVMGFVRATLSEEPDRRQLVMGQLETELNHYLRRSKTAYAPIATGRAFRGTPD
jgi:hypothetical protein